MTWDEVDNDQEDSKAQVEDISVDNGLPFDMVLTDIDGDGDMDLVYTNHQPSSCDFPDAVKGRIGVLKQGDNMTWTNQILMDDLQPQPNLSLRPGSMGRSAPGSPRVFCPNRKKECPRPWIVVGGDESGKVYLLEPKGKKGTDFARHIIFDINDVYGSCATQTPFGEFEDTVSTIGTVAVRYTKEGVAEIYIPVFEAGDIHVYTFDPKDAVEEVTCTDADVLGCNECQAPPPDARDNMFTNIWH